MNEEEEIRELPQQSNVHQIYRIRLRKSAPATQGRAQRSPPQERGGWGPGPAAVLGADVTPWSCWGLITTPPVENIRELL